MFAIVFGAAALVFVALYAEQTTLEFDSQAYLATPKLLAIC
jgi:hypothetical protein